jgi:putative flippase GtrA
MNQFVKFYAIGILASIVNFVLFYILIEYFNFHYLLSNVVAYIIPVLISYFLNSAITFKNVEKNKDIFSLFKYIAMRISSLLIDSFILFIAIDILNFNPYISKIISAVIVTIFSFLLTKKILEPK